MEIKKGETVLISTGEYSDYTVKALVRATQDFHPKEMSDEYLARFPDQAEDYGVDFYMFTNWLVNEKKVLEEIEHREWHLGDYGSFSHAVTP